MLGRLGRGGRSLGTRVAAGFAGAGFAVASVGFAGAGVALAADSAGFAAGAALVSAGFAAAGWAGAGAGAAPLLPFALLPPGTPSGV